MQKRLVVITLVLLTGLLVTTALLAQTKLDTGAIDALVNALMQAYDVPGASFAVVDDGEIVYAQGYGVRSTATNEPVTPETQFNIGSITKSVTSLAIAEQVDAGVLDLDTPIVEYLPDFRLSDPEATQKLTLRHLLSNSGGFQPNDFVWFGGAITTLEEVPQAISEQPVVAEPGTINAYNNLGYALAGYVLQEITGQSWADLIRDTVFAPLELTDASISFDEMQQTDNHVVPHLLDVRTGMQPIPFFENFAPIAPAGAVNMNIVELANYALFQLGDGTFNGQRIVSPERLAEMHAPQIDGYGLGWVSGEHAGYQTVWHNGSIDGFGALVVLVPSEKLAVVGMMNADYFDNVGFLDGAVLRIVEIALGIEPETDVIEELQTQTGLDPAVRQPPSKQPAALKLTLRHSPLTSAVMAIPSVAT